MINGSKMWTTNGAQADWICLLATTGEGEPHRNKSLICVPMDTPGITVARKIEKLGKRERREREGEGERGREGGKEGGIIDS